MSELPRLLFCCFDVVPGPSAISRRLTEYIKGLSERFQVVVLSAKTPDHPHIERYHGARLLRVPVGSGDLPSRSQTFDRAVRRQLESEDYGLVHFFDPFAGYALCEKRGDLGYRLVYDACTFPSVELPLENPALATNRRFIARVRRQELFCLMNADGVVVGSPLTADYVAGLGVDREQVRVLRAPVDLEPFKPEVMGKPDATPMKVLHLGRATRGQGLELLLEAMHLALQTVDIRLTLVSPKNPEAQARLEALVAERKLTGKVEFQDPVAHDDIHKVLATADVGALTLDDVERNQQVGTPLARLGEYLAAGRPVIAADVAAARALLPAEGAVLYRPGDAGSLADALVQLATDTARRVKLGAAARAAAAEWDSARVQLELVKLYAEVTGARPEAIRADAPADPYEPTQLGRLPSDSGEVTQLRRGVAEDSNVGTNKVKTDPAIAASTDSSTDASGRAERPPIMGVPLREDTPEESARQAVTEPGARPSGEPPVVMGSPLRGADEGPASAASVADALEDAEPAATSSAPPVPEEAPLASFDDDVRTDLRAPGELPGPPEPTPSVPTVPEAAEPGAPSVASTPAVVVPPLAEPPKPALPEEDEPFFPALIAASAPKPGPPIPTGSSPGVAAPASVAALRGAPAPVTKPAPPIPTGSSPGRAAPASVAALRGTPPGGQPVVKSSDALETKPVAPVSPSARTDSVPPVPAPAAPQPTSRTDSVPPVPAPAAPLPTSRTDSVPPVPAPAAPLPTSRTDSVPPVPAPAAPLPTSRTDSVPPVPAPAASGPLGTVGAAAKPVASAPPPPAITAPGGPAAGGPPPIPPRRATGTFPVAPGPDAAKSSSTVLPAVPAPAAGNRAHSTSLPAMVPPPTRSSSTSIPAVSLPAAPKPASSTSLPAMTAPDAPAKPPSATSLPTMAAPAKQSSSSIPAMALPAAPAKQSSTALPAMAAPARTSSMALPAVPAPAVTAKPAAAADDDVAEIGADEVMDVEEPSDTSEEIMDADEAIQTVDTDPSPPPSALDPWLAQLVHGYCPPESHLFDRHTPPTTMPGRDT